MAKVKNNIVTQGLSGLLGNQIVFRKDKTGRTIVAVKPTFPANRTFNTSQLAHQEAFRQAIAYAKTAKAEDVYLTKAQGTTMSAFNAAVADWFNKPQVLEINASGWNGEIGQSIRIKAMDDTLVTNVHVMITDVNGTILEQGDAAQGEGQWWVYTSTTQISGEAEPRIVATAQDLPGNNGELAWQN